MSHMDNPHVGYRIDFSNRTFYLGVTTNLKRRINLHRANNRTGNYIRKYCNSHPEIDWEDIDDHYTVEILGWFKDGYDARYWEEICHRSAGSNCVSNTHCNFNNPLHYPGENSFYNPRTMEANKISCYSANLT